MSEPERDLLGVAITGMAGRFPGARSVDEFWDVLAAGRETVRDLTDEELRGSELDFERIGHDPAYVRRRGILDDADHFDAAFFGYSPREAALIDPQQRVWLEAAWDALEDAGVAPAKFPGKIGVFGGSYINGYLLYNLCRDRDYIERLVRFRAADAFQALISNDKDYLPTRTSYKLNLTGPSINVQTACSTALVAVCEAVRSLLNHDADVCLAGGVCVPSPQHKGYLYQEGGMVSRDGHCRPFDARASGTVFSAGVGIVVLRRLADAIADGDHIRAVIRGVAVNNDGSDKVSFTAPSVQGQAEVIAMAQAMADVDPATITYVEAHGTATPLGDPIEVAALTKAFRMRTARTGFCGLGSVKSNVGHLDAASGAAGLIKTVLAMEHGVLPPSLHYESPNPEIDFATSPFYVVDRLREWTVDGPRRAGVSSFGVGGTNAHVVLEEAPRVPAPPDDAAGAWQVLPLSARTASALTRRAADLADHLARAPGLTLPSLARTLQEGRQDWEHRRIIVARSADGAEAALRASTHPLVSGAHCARTIRTVAFMFPGQGAQHPNMGRELYETEPVYRAVVDRCAEALRPRLGLDLREVLHVAPDAVESAAATLTQTAITQPALFTVELATAELWRSLGVEPAVMIGHSIGEFTAACVAGVLSVDDALRVIAERARLMAAQEPGSMLAVQLPPEALRPYLRDPAVVIAVVNGPRLVVASGPHGAVAALRARLTDDGVETTELHTSHAYHSAMMEPALAPFREAFAGVALAAPRIPMISCVTGTWLTSEQARDPGYWVHQLRATVQFSTGVAETAARADALLEVGPGRTLATLARQSVADPRTPVVASLPHVHEDVTARAALLRAAGQLWTHGYDLDWARVRRGTAVKLRAPAYPFERERYWIEPPSRTPAGQAAEAVPALAPAMPAAAPVTGPTASLRTVLLGELERMMRDLSGMDVSAEQRTLSFLELGLDSLFLTQLSAELYNRLGVRVRFRQLFDEIPTLEALAAHVERELPPERAAALRPAAPAPAAAVPPVQAAGGGAVVAAGGLEQRLGAIERQLADLLGAAGVTGPAAIGAPARPGVPVPPAYASAPATGRFGPYKQIERARDGGLTERQRAHLDDLVHLLTSRTPRSKEVAQRFRHRQADPRSIANFRAIWKELVYQVVATHAKGSRITDLDGNEYVDITMGFGINLFGHSADWINEAIAAQLGRGFPIGPQAELAGEVATLLAELTGMERVSFCNTGSEAVMAALRMARTVTGRDLVVYFAGDYHGVFDEVLARPQVTDGRLTSAPIAPGIPAGSLGNILVLEYGNPHSLEVIRSLAGSLAAVLVEPVQSRHPELRPGAFARELRALTADAGAALIFDEVITGFRVHPGGMQAAYGVRADLATYGKVIGGGLPIGAVAGAGRFMDTLDGGPWRFGDDSVPESDVTFFAGTFVRHPLTLAAAKAVLTHLRAEGPALQEQLNQRTTAFADDLNAFFEDAEVPIRIRQYSSWFRFDTPADLVYAPLLFFHLIARGVYVREPGQNCFFSTAHTDEDIAYVARAVREATGALQRAGYLPGRPVPETLPLTGPQQEIRVTSALGPDASCAFNECFQISLRGPLDRAAFVRAVGIAVGRHEALRMRFDAEGLHQRRGAVPDGPALEDLSGLSSADRDAAVAAAVRQEQETPFDLTAGPLLRSRLLRLDDAEHLWICTAHHIVFDGWSSTVLVEDIRDAYNAAARRLPADLRPAERFTTFVTEETRRQEDGPGDDLRYWTTVFADLPGPLELPTDRPRGALRRYDGETFRWEFSAGAYEAARTLARATGTTLYTTLLAAYFVLLHRLTGQTDLVVGIPVAGQSITGREHLVGHCLNLLPVRARPRSELRFTDFLRTVKDLLLDAHEHQTVSLGAIVRAVNPPRHPARLPLVEVIFNLDRRLPALDFTGLEAAVEECGKRSANFDMFVNFNEVEGAPPRLTLNLDFASGLFTAATVEEWVREYERLLLRLAGDRDATIAALAAAPAAAGAAGPGLRGAARDLPDGTIDEMVLRAAARHPDATAVQCGPARLSYGQLARRVHALAARLLETGTGPGDRVGLAMGRSVDMLAAVLAVVRTGAAYVPLDPAFPAERLRFMITDAGLRTLVTQPDAAADLPEDGVPRIVLDPDDPLEGYAGRTVPSRARADDPAYVIYTSGSTGTPKGVVVHHRAVVNFLASMAVEPGLDPQDVLMAVTTLSFDIALLELLLPLTVGARVVIASADESADGTLLARLLDAAGATVMQATPTQWRMLVDAGWQGTGREFRCFSGGEPLPADLAAALRARCTQLWNLYGPTETTIWSTCHRVETPDGPVPIGRPIANTPVYLLDEARRPVPRGATGEIYIGGPGVALGYLARPELTAERFLPDPFAGAAGARMYRTGDLGRLRRDGTLEHRGRTDAQVKVRGFRVELGEIEAALSALDTVRQAAVVLRRGDRNDDRLVAYVVPAGAAVPADDLRTALAARLPAFMIPHHFVTLSALPTTPNGKVDRAALARRAVEAAAGSPGSRAPASPAESAVARVFADVLGLDRVGADDDFFDLGGHSVLAMRVVARLRDGPAPALGLRDLFEAPTVAALAERIRSLNGDGGRDAADPADREEVVL